MSRPFGDDDPYDRPEFFDREMEAREQVVEANIERLEGLANEKHDIADLF